MLEIRTTADTLTFPVIVQPRSSKLALAGCYQNALKVKLTAPPVEGAANKQCIQILAKTLAIPKSDLTIISGQTTRRKRIQIRSTPENIKILNKKLRELAA